MGSNFSLGLQRRSQYPGLDMELGPGASVPDNVDPNPLAYGGQGARTSASGQPAQAEPQEQTASTRPRLKAPSAGYYVAKAMMGRGGMAGMIGAMLAAKEDQQLGENRADVAAWDKDRQDQLDQAKINMERSYTDRAGRVTPDLKPLSYQVPGSSPAPGAQGPVKPSSRGVAWYDTHSSTPPQLPEGAEPYEHPDRNITPYEDFRQGNQDTPLAWESAMEARRAGAQNNFSAGSGGAQKDPATGKWYVTRTNKKTGGVEMVEVPVAGGGASPGSLERPGQHKDKKPGIEDFMGDSAVTPGSKKKFASEAAVIQDYKAKHKGQAPSAEILAKARAAGWY